MDERARAGRKGKGKQKPDVDEVTKEVSTMQDDRKRMYRRETPFMDASKRDNHFQEAIGGFIQGYEFDQNLLQDEFDMAEGFLIVKCDTDASLLTQHLATFFKVQAKDGKATAERIFEHSMKLRGSTAVATAYLIAKSAQLNRWIICYEKLTGYLEDKIESLKPFYDAGGEMSAWWKKQLREIIKALSDMGLRGTFHGGMSTPKNYTISSSGDIKLIGVRKNVDEKTVRDDVVEFEAFLSVNTEASTDPDWKGFKALIDSDAMFKLETWAGAVLGHSLLLDPESKIMSYLELHVWTNRILYPELISFCNALWCILPGYHGCTLHKYISSCKVCVKVARKDYYDGKNIYMDIIKFIKNLVLHGRDDLGTGLLGKINNLFPGFMSVAYAVSKFEPDDMKRLFTAKNNILPYK